MLLPCPHCKRQFKLAVEQIKSETVKVKCPTCEGIFVIQLSQDVPAGKDSLDVTPGKDLPDPSPSVPAPEGLPSESGNNGSHVPISSDIAGALAIEEDLFHDPAPQPSELSLVRRIISPRYLYGLLALTSIFLLVFLLSIGSSNRRPLPRDSEDKASANLAAVTIPEEKPVSGEVAVTEENTEAPAWDLIAKDTISRAFWSSSPLEAEDPCALLPRIEVAAADAEELDSCQHYPQWIAYLVLENAPTPVCKLESTFNHAKAAVKKENLCGQGYAFLAAYYVQKKIIGQSHSYLEKALELSPQSPWVRVVEALFYERIRNDRGKALATLQELDEKSPGFSLARYLLAKIYIKQEEYEKADPIFRFLQKEYAEQDAFGKIQQSLASIDDAPYYSTVKAKGLLDLSRDFSELRDRPMAEHLCRKVLEEMSGRLPEEERKAAYCELGQIYESRGDKSSAYDSYSNALKIDPKFQDARERLEHLL